MSLKTSQCAYTMCHNMYSTSPQSWVNCFAECGLAGARWAVGGGSAFPLTYHFPGQGIPTQPPGCLHNRHAVGALVLLLLVSCMVIPVATHGQLTFAQRGFRSTGKSCCRRSLGLAVVSCLYTHPAILRGWHALMLNCRHHRQLWQGITMSSAVWIHFSILLTNRRIPL